MFEFRETSAFSENFADFDVDDMNFFMQSGSIPLIAILCVANFVVMWCALCLAFRYFRNFYCRRIGMRAEEDVHLGTMFLKIYFEGYVELLLAAALTTCAVVSRVDADEGAAWFETSDEAFHSSVAIISFVFLLFLPIWLQYKVLIDRKELESSDTYGALYDGHNIRYKVSRYFWAYGLFKRCTCCLVLFVLDGEPFFQLAIFMVF
jgi:hypothetical protein